MRVSQELSCKKPHKIALYFKALVLLKINVQIAFITPKNSFDSHYSAVETRIDLDRHFELEHQKTILSTPFV